MYGNDFSLEEHFVNEYQITGVVLFCKETKDVKLKLQVAYDWLVYICDKLKKKHVSKCRQFLARMRKEFDKEEISKNNCIMKEPKLKEMARLWDEVQIFLQEICSDHWYFVKQDNETYVFKYITQD